MQAMKSGLSIVYRRAADLRPYEKNSRTHSAEQVDQIAASIREFGWTNPILVDENDLIIAGHGRLLAAAKVEMAEVPVIVLAGLTPAQRRALTVADNKLALNAGWDDALLRSELGELKAEGFDLTLTGFSDLELGALFAASTAGLTDPDAVPPVPEEPVSKPGDLWKLNGHRLLCGDSTSEADVARVLGDVRPHLMVTDPPYGVEYDPTRTSDNPQKAGKVLNDDRADWREAWALFPGDVAYVWHADRFTHIVLASLEACEFRARAMIVWVKDRFTLGRGHYHWQHEPAWYVVRKSGTGHWTGGRSQSTVWNIPAREDKGHGHGTQKPVECMKRPIENNSSPGQAVYEPFSGSGTTIIAAEMTGRSCHAIELNPAYVDVAVRRWQEFTGQKATLAADGRTFEEVTSARTETETA